MTSAHRGFLLAAALACLPAAPAAAPIPAQQVQQAVEKLRADPDFGGTKTEKSLHFKNMDKPKPKEPEVSDWLAHLVRWLSETGRLLMWLGAAVMAAFLLVGARRWIRIRGDPLLAERERLPSHVQSLDIRPESLPDDVGAAAATLWQRGQHRAALSLLYRGALSGLVHAHQVPIRASSTEGECVALAQRHLEAGRGDFFARLVAVWQPAVYGARLPETQRVLALCSEFDLHLRQRALATGAT